MPYDQNPLYPDSPMPRIQRRNLQGEAETVITADGETIDADESATTHDGDVYHRDSVCNCEMCGDAHHSESGELRLARANDGYRIARSQSLRCENCRSQCSDCNEHFDSLDNLDASDDRICRRCAESYCSCESCSCIIHVDDSHCHNDSTLCQSCYNAAMEADESEDESEDESAPRIRDYHYKPSPVFYPAPSPISAFCGLEIECEDKKRYGCRKGLKDCGLPAEFYAKSDGSLDDGMEIVSHPGTYEYWMGHSFAFTDKLRALGFRAYDTETCGLHIHVSKSFLSTPQITRLLAFARDNMQFMYFLSRRKQLESMTRYCKLKDGSIKGLRSFAKGVCVGPEFDAEFERWARDEGGFSVAAYPNIGALPRNIRRSWEQRQRYTAINPLNPSTIEFRIYRGTLNVESIKRNIAVTMALVHYAKSVKRFASLTTDHFADWVSSKGAGVLGADMSAKVSDWIGQYKKGEVRPETEAA